MKTRAGLEKKIAEFVYRLPPRPENIERLFQHASGSARDEQIILNMVSDDPGLCAELLRLANMCGTANTEVVTISDAVNSVGIAPLVQLIGTAYANQVLLQQFAPLNHLDQYFAHSREIAHASGILASLANLSPHDREMHKVAGLLHDIGRLVIMISANETSVPLIGTTWDQMNSILAVEQETIGMNHCEVGAEVCQRWEFAHVLQHAILRHHTPFSSGNFNFSGALIFLAHFVSSSDFTGEIISKFLPGELFSRLGLKPTDLDVARLRLTQGPRYR